MDDCECIVAVLSGDKSAFRLLLERYEHKVYGFVLKMLKDPQLAEDVTQETFLAVYRSLRQYDRAKPFSTWIFTIAKHNAFKVLRVRSKSDILPDDAFCDLTENRDLVEPQVMRGEDQMALMAALELLSDIQNQALTLRYFEELNLEEISQRMDLPKKKVENILFSAKKKLRSVLEKNEEDNYAYAQSN